MMRTFLILTLVAAVACSNGGGSTPQDASASDIRDVSSDGLTPFDGPSTGRCASDRECSARGMVCNTALAMCVECNVMGDCTGGRSCVGNRCVTTVSCTSSRMCPGQVCSMRLGYCVDCDMDVDCTGGQVCRANVCVAPPRMCRSSRECNDMGQVCDTTRSICVECAADADCSMAQFCDPAGICRARVCTPGATECVDAGHVRTCDSHGSIWTVAACNTGLVCAGGRCQSRVCAPGAADCASPTSMRTCNPDGFGYATADCGTGQSCRDGACVMQSCMPGSATCASMTERRVCAADGLSTMVVACASTEGCRDGTCVTHTCAPESAMCTSTTMRAVCNADGFGTTPASCGSMQRCASGACVDLVCVPGSSSCVDAHTVRACSSDGTSAMSLTCPSGSTCTGTMCSSWVCTPGMTTCPTGATARTVCNTDGLATHSDACVAPANASMARCDGVSACTFTCNAGFGDCNMIAADGCEANGFTDPMNCGGCGNVCAARANTTRACMAGVCDYHCNAGFSDCDGNAANGCEADLTSAANCGRCGNACAAATPTCSSGACILAPLTRYTVSPTPPPISSWIDACAAAGATMVLPGADDTATLRPLAFNFRYWAADMTMGAMVDVTSNGFISLAGIADASLSGTIPSSATPNAVIAAYWGDDQNRTTGQCLATVGAAPSRRQVFEWNDAEHCCGESPGTHLTYEIVLNESGPIDFLYLRMDGARPQTVGIENQGGTIGLGGCPGATGSMCAPATGSTVRFVPSP